MKKKDLDKFKKLLEEKKDKILRHLEDLSNTSENGMNDATGDPVDLASVEISQANLQKIGKREQYLAKKIELALNKIKDETYGECESCGEQIALARLEARPEAQLCIDCKTEQENIERRFSSGTVEEEEGSDELFEGDEAE